ncbi:hypothetical protein SAMN05660359_03403 [Geodermatophilus obscurus]|jgi:uncharacterized membrane protein YgcG|uniref:Uncharacterized protein n=1 Tax=Geodermatophilus obscurus TaxID=1861 RepID=A0A1I5H3N0_9ACTN|nr:hypothetical protein [Geodermatophilus obscurus]SFO42894.1 hypothetical protein SAMN05660359_03403 [Geodermatophilus obscurus]
MTVIVLMAVFSAVLFAALAVHRRRSVRGSWSDGSYRRGHAPGYLAGGAYLADGGGGGVGGGFDGGGGGGGDGGGGGC